MAAFSPVKFQTQVVFGQVEVIVNDEDTKRANALIERPDVFMYESDVATRTCGPGAPPGLMPRRLLAMCVPLLCAVKVALHRPARASITM